MAQVEETSPVVVRFWQSRALAFWRRVWKWMPWVASRCCSFAMYSDGSVWWERGYAQMVYLEGNRSLTITWYLSEKWPPQRIIQLSQATHWDKPHENIKVTQAETEKIKAKLLEYCGQRKIRILQIQ